MSLLQRARIHLQQARQEATHGVTANNAFIDLMVDEALNLLSAHMDDTDDKEALLKIEKLLRPETYGDDDDQVANAWEIAHHRVGWQD